MWALLLVHFLEPLRRQHYVALGHCHLLLGRVREIQAHDTDPGAAFFSSTARSEVDYLYSDFGAASSGRFMPRDSSDAIVTPKLLLRLESLPWDLRAAHALRVQVRATLDLIAEVLADTLSDQVTGMGLAEAAVEAVPLYVGSDTVLVFQGLCLGRMIDFLERRLLRGEEEHPKKLDKDRFGSLLLSYCSIHSFMYVFILKMMISDIFPSCVNRWAANLDTLSWLLVDRAFVRSWEPLQRQGHQSRCLNSSLL